MPIDACLISTTETDVAYILTQQNLRRLAAIHGVCGGDPDGGPAYDAATNRIFVPCRDGGIQQIDLCTNTLGPKLPGANGAPILIGTELWAAQYPDGTVSEFNAVSGASMQTVQVGSSIPNFTTPSTALGLLLVGTSTGVTAFEGPG